MISRFSRELSEGRSSQVEPGEGAPVLTSCGDLFVFYRKCLVQLSELTSGQTMVELAGLFKKYLREYISKVIVASLPKIGNTSAGGASALNLPAMSQLSQIKDLS